MTDQQTQQDPAEKAAEALFRDGPDIEFRRFVRVIRESISEATADKDELIGKLWELLDVMAEWMEHDGEATGTQMLDDYHALRKQQGGADA